MNNLLGYNGIIRSHSTRDETTLIWPNYVTQKRSQSIHQNFRQSLIASVQETNRPKQVDFLWVLLFRNQNNVSFISIFRDFIILKIILNVFTRGLPNNPPKFVIKESINTIRVRAFDPLILKKAFLISSGVTGATRLLSSI